MTIEFRHPLPHEEADLRRLFTEAFADAAFTDLFFRTGFSPDRCLAAFDGGLLAALHWFNSRLEGQKAAYVYGIAAFRAHRGLGIGSKLIREAVRILRACGYDAILLVPAEPSLFGYYERFGFQGVSTIREDFVTAGNPLPIRELTAAEYAEARRTLLPEHSLVQEGAALDLFSGYAKFFATDRALAAVTDHMVWELLGDADHAPGLIAALKLPAATIRTPGPGRPFAMGIGVEGPIYLGLALD